MMCLRNALILSVLSMAFLLQPQTSGVSATSVKKGATIENFVDHVKNFDHQNDPALILHHERMKREACRFSTCDHDDDCPDWCNHCSD
eukprot:Awhi_evm1s6916